MLLKILLILEEGSERDSSTHSSIHWLVLCVAQPAALAYGMMAPAI